jgi:hypothetical protein
MHIAWGFFMSGDNVRYVLMAMLGMWFMPLVCFWPYMNINAQPSILIVVPIALYLFGAYALLMAIVGMWDEPLLDD